MAPVSLLMCEVFVGGEHGGAAAVFPRDGGTNAGMAWCEPTPRPKQTLTRLRGKKGGKSGAAARFAGVRGRDGREPNDNELAKCRSPRGDLFQPKSGKDGGAQGELGDARRRGKTQRRGHKEQAKLSAAMAVALPPWSRERERQGESGQALSECGASWHP